MRTSLRGPRLDSNSKSVERVLGRVRATASVRYTK